MIFKYKDNRIKYTLFIFIFFNLAQPIERLLTQYSFVLNINKENEIKSDIRQIKLNFLQYFFS